MPQKVIRFKGINRRINEFQTSGECEDLINLRPQTTGGLAVVKPKVITEYDVNYDAYYEHKWGSHDNRIASIGGIIYWVNAGDDPVVISNRFYGKDVAFSSAGNVLVLYCDDDKSQLVFKFNDGNYEEYDIIIPQIESVSIEASVNRASFTATPSGNTTQEFAAALNGAVGGFYTENPHGLCGISVIGFTYELEDGSELCSTGFIVANAGKFMTITPGTKKEDNITKVSVSGLSGVYLRISLANLLSDKIRKINVYGSKPIYPYEVADVSVVGSSVSLVPRAKSIDSIHLDSQILYYQGSMEVKPDMRFMLNFGNTLTGEKILDVDAGAVQRIGPSVSYNNRFNYFRSDAIHTIQTVTASDDTTDEDNSRWIAYVQFDTGKTEWKLTRGVHSFSATEAQDFIYPMSNIKKIAFVKGSIDSDGLFTTPYSEMFYVDMNNSSAYNYSYAFGVTPNIVPVGDFYDTIASANQLNGYYDKEIKLKEEINALNVSAPFNPHIFPVKYSYSFGGEVLDIATAYVPISATQIGQYPLTVFTSNGIYAMEQGSGDVLYSNVIPIQPHVMSGNACATPYGTFFCSDGHLYVLSGREVADVSYILEGNSVEALIESDAYVRLIGKEGEGLYNFSPILSSGLGDFNGIAAEPVLIYDQMNNEVCISGPRSVRSYVFNIDTKQYHVIAKKYIKPYAGARFVLEEDTEMKNIVDMRSENHSTQPILLRTRPMSLDVLYTHIQRLIMHVDVQLVEQDKDYLCLSVFASDNLYDWKCIISSQKKDTVLRHIRTNKAAKSYKDYIILISGSVQTETDISDLIADYTVVNRRLG